MTDTPRAHTDMDRLAEEWLDTMLELQPELHVDLGRPGRESDYSDLSPDGVSATSGATRSMLARVRKTETVDSTDTLTKAELIRTLELDVEQIDAGFWQRDLNVIASPCQNFRAVFDSMPSETDEDWANIAKRLSNLPAAMIGYIESLRAGVRSGRVPAIRQVREVSAEAVELAGADSFFSTLIGRTGSLRSDLETGARAAASAYEDLRRFLDDELAPHAREADAVGREDYTLASRAFVGVDIDLDETYEWGVSELARMVDEQEAIAREILPGAGVAEAIAHLESDPARKLHGTVRFPPDDGHRASGISGPAGRMSLWQGNVGRSRPSTRSRLRIG